MIGWVKLHRAFLDWEWYDDLNVRILFIHLLLTVNFEDKKWKGRLVKKGSRITGRIQLAKECCMSEQNVRTAIKKLESTNDLTIEKNALGTMFTVVNWNKYQDVNQSTNQQTNHESTSYQPDTNHESTTTKEVNNLKNKESNNSIEKKEIFNFRKYLIDFGFENDLIDDWLKVRKTKKATNTQTAFNSFIKEVEKSNKDINEILKICIEKDWKGFKNEWLTNIENQKNGTGTKPAKVAATYNRQRAIEKLQQRYNNSD